MRLDGTGGFTFIGVFGQGVAGPGCCLAPGETGTIFGRWVGNDLPGIATYAGETYTDISDAGSINQASMAIVSDSFVAPPATQPGFTTTVVVPFAFSGHFQGTPGDGRNVLDPTLIATLTGGGMAHLSLTFFPGGPWTPGDVHLDFTNPTPTPEPSSLMLLGLGVVGVYVIRRRTARAVEQRLKNATIS
jgi:hypothetical protein